ncbi:Abortive infection protein (plasmid) [Deinococcus proteolyticus MRP]|uniref:Abortive infection protein n=1 Tax=Deinococcus proteolyticus (strain ATCC 35074 / DSM 20540 / JCM 6276 / NBRC 101906 / NCIMB 13154 / VKM Ac-1939 / CCM 2703 / MRP) TaxID=693977 RepID=F0RRA8_DEIPM|nr:CPBP family intramembrane glutamic endopeptidase [Deinococcus proteolyticus]ADY27817.1 Abortive infection protein [Deinococcus proteolyticus MRP]
MTTVALTYVAALGYAALNFPAGFPLSADAGAAAAPLWAIIGPPLAAAALAAALPYHPQRLPVDAGEPRNLRLTAALLLALALAFPLLTQSTGMAGGYIAAKVALLIALPLVAVRLLPGAIRLPRLQARRLQGRPWWVPLGVVTFWFITSQLGPWNPLFDGSAYDMTTIVVAALVTAVTAGFGEELFYRRLLQSRLEALLGAWPGIALASLAFALMHLGSHGSADLPGTLARIIVAQGSFGLFAGVLWWRYRSLVWPVAAHLLVNGWGVVAYLLGL